MYRKYYTSILFLVIVIGLVSCRKDDQWKLPTKMKTIIHCQNDISTSNNIVFTNGYINLAEFSFNGEREQGENVYFTKPLSGGLIVPFSDTPVSEFNFDIPQGTYDKILISFNTFEASRSDSNETNDHMTSINSIEMNGIFSDSMGEDYSIKFELNSQEYFSVIAQNKDGNNKIILNKDIPVTAYITFNPEFWFKTISSEMLENAETMDNENKNRTILINEDTNISLYDIIVNRIGKELKIVIK